MSLKSISLLIAMILWSSAGMAQPAIEWQVSPSTVYGTGFPTINLVQTADKGYVYFEHKFIDVTAADAVVTKLGADGKTQWQKQIGGKGYNFVTSIIQTDDGGYLFAGSIDSSRPSATVHGRTDCWVVKLDANGEIQWQRCYGGANSDAIRSIVQTRGGESPEYVFAAMSNSNDGDVTGNHIVPIANDFSIDTWLVKIGGTGNIIWEKSIGGSDRDEVYQLIKDSSGALVFAGWSVSKDGDVSSSNKSLHTWVVKLRDSSIVWSKSFNRGINDEARSICQTSDGGYAIAGDADSTLDVYQTQLDKNALLIKVDADGNTQWWRNIGGTGYDGFTYVAATTDGGTICTGSTTSTDGDIVGRIDPDQNDVLVAKFVPSGNTEWSKVYGGSGADYGACILQSSDGGFAFSAITRSSDGDVTSNPGLTINSWVVKLKTTASVSTSGGEPSCLIFPQPLNKRATVVYRSTTPSPAHIEIVSVLGKNILQTTDNNIAIGERETELDLEAIPSGSYFLKLQIGNESSIQKLIKF